MVVLDTNVLVAALWSRKGGSFQIVDRALRGELQIAVSVALVLEYEDVLKRAAMREASWANIVDLDVILDTLLAHAKLVSPITVRGRPFLRDANDDMVLECALQARADAIVTMNLRDFALVPGKFGVDIVNPGLFLARMKGYEQ